MKPIPTPRCPATRLVALGAAAIAAFAVTASPAAAMTIPVGGMAVEHASLDWTGSAVMQTPLPFGGGLYHYFSAGVSDGTEATYRGAEGDAEVLLEAEGPEAVATWATHKNYGAEPGHHQVVRLLDGAGRIEADGSAKISWDASFSVNFYNGMAPFSIEDPTLVVNPDGTGELTATLSGCKASRTEPGCAPFTPVPGAQVATFAGVQIDPEAPLTVTPNYAGVEVETPGAGTPQNRTVEGWGAWPQSMVTFQDETGLSSYFYSSGSGEDPKKPPLPFVVDLKGPKPTPPATSTTTTPATTTTTPPVTTPSPTAAKLTILKGARKLRANGVATLARLTCPRGGATCTASAPKRLAVPIGGKRYVLAVMFPKHLAAGKSATLRVRLPKAARRALGAKKLLIKLKIALRANGLTTKRVVKVKIAGRR